MRILIVTEDIDLPVKKYGGTERLVWWLGKELHRLGHRISFLAGKGSDPTFARILSLDPVKPVVRQIPDDVDIVHVFGRIRDSSELKIPYLCTIGGLGRPGALFDHNTVFVSKKHAYNHHSDAFVYNGLDFDDYGAPALDIQRKHLLFLAKASVRYKNLRGCIRIARKLNETLSIVGGHGFSLDWRIRYRGLLGGERKNREIQNAKALLFPVLWEEPFGLAIVEALYFGCPVFGTPYGSLPELVTRDVGFLADNSRELIAAIREGGGFSRTTCHEYARDTFNVRKMAQDYLRVYDRVLAGQVLNPVAPVRRDFPRRYEFE